MTQEIFQRMDRLAFEALRPSDVLTEMTQQQFEEAMKQRTVLYDAECLYEDQDLIDLVLQFVNATRGEWSPQNLRAEWDSFTGIASGEFDFRGGHVTWTCHQESDWVDIDFYAQLGAFTQHFLSGDFVNMSRNDQFSEYLYLPRSIVAETAFLARLAKEPSLDHNLFIRVFEVLQQHGLLAELTLQQQVYAWDSFSLLRELLPGRCIEDVSGRISKTENLGERYEYLIDALAEITAGEWAPTQTHSSFEKGKKQVTIGFDFREGHFTCTFEQHSTQM